MKILNPIIYVLVVCIGFFLSILNDYLFYLSIRGLSFIAKKLDKRRKNNALSNLDFIFENKLKESEKLKIIDRCYDLSLIHISEPTRQPSSSRMPSSA